MANLVSLAAVSKTHRVYMDAGIDNAFHVFNSDGTYVRFGLCKHTNLYTLDIGTTKPELSLSHTTVEEEKGKYSAIDIRRAKKVR